MDSDVIEKKNNTILKLTLVLDKLFTVLDDFRQNLNDFQKSCNCIENHKNKSNFDELEVEYKTIVEEYNQNKYQIDAELDLNSDLSKPIAGRLTTDPNGQKSSPFDANYLKSQTRPLRTWSRRKKDKIKCSECENKFWNNKLLFDHQKNVHKSSRCQSKTGISSDANNAPEDSSNDKMDINFVFGSNLLNVLRHRTPESSQELAEDVVKGINEMDVRPVESEGRKGNRYLCDHCDIETTSYDLMKCHQSLVHNSHETSSTDSLVCSNCHSKFSDISLLSEHQNSCPSVFDDFVSAYLKNLKSNSGPLKSRTHQSLAMIKKVNEMDGSVTKIDGRKKNSYSCDECNFVTTNYLLMNGHKRLVHNYRKRSGSRLHVCLNCELKFPEFMLLLEHQKSCFDFFFCDHISCSFQTNSRTHFEEHRITHSKSNANDCQTIESQKPNSESNFEQNVEIVVKNEDLFKDFTQISDKSLENSEQNDFQSNTTPEDFLSQEQTQEMTIQKIGTDVKDCDIKQTEQISHSMANLMPTQTQSNGSNKEKNNLKRMDSPFICRKCNYKTYYTHKKITHLRYYHIRQCPQCSTQCKGSINFIEHMTIAHRPLIQQKTIKIESKADNSSDKRTDEESNGSQLEPTSLLSSLSFEGKYKQYKGMPSKQLESKPKRKTYKYFCTECDFKSSGPMKMTSHKRSKHNLYDCPQYDCYVKNMFHEELRQHLSREHKTLINEWFTCEAEDCGFQSEDRQLFNEHKTKHLTENIDKIIDEFKSGIETKSQTKEQTTDYVNAHQFLEQTSKLGPISEKFTFGSTLVLGKQPFVSQKQLPSSGSECSSVRGLSSGAGRRIRGLNSAREPILLAKNKTTKKISELFKK